MINGIFKGLKKRYVKTSAIDLPINQWLEDDRRLDEEVLVERITDEVVTALPSAAVSKWVMKQQLCLKRHFMLNSLDRHWKDHLAAMDYLRQGIHLRGYAQKNPEQEYKKEAYNLFVNMLGDYQI